MQFDQANLTSWEGFSEVVGDWKLTQEVVEVAQLSFLPAGPPLYSTVAALSLAEIPMVSTLDKKVHFTDKERRISTSEF